MFNETNQIKNKQTNTCVSKQKETKNLKTNQQSSDHRKVQSKLTEKKNHAEYRVDNWQQLNARIIITPSLAKRKKRKQKIHEKTQFPASCVGFEQQIKT